jgi:hypothetical protein
MSKKLPEVFPAPQIESKPETDQNQTIGQQSAAEVFENAKNYLEGTRPKFYAFFAANVPWHKVALEKFDALLAESDFAEETPLGIEYGSHDARFMGDERRFQIAYRQVAANAGRVIISKSMSECDPKSEVDNVSYVTEMPNLETKPTVAD